MSFSRKKRKELDDDDDDDIPMNDDESDANDEDEKGELSSPSATTAPAGNGNTPTKLKCLKCFRAARKDCTGGLCIRCCTDKNCVVHEEQRAKARWKEAVIAGTTEIQVRARHKRARAIPKGRFKERAFRYMNDTVVLWDLRTVLEPSLPQRRRRQQQQQQSSAPAVVPPRDEEPQEKSPTSTTTTAINFTSTSLSSVSATGMAQYQNDLKTREEILRRSRKNNHSSSKVGGTKTKVVRRNYRGTKKRFRGVMEDLFERSLD